MSHNTGAVNESGRGPEPDAATSVQARTSLTLQSTDILDTQSRDILDTVSAAHAACLERTRSARRLASGSGEHEHDLRTSTTLRVSSVAPSVRHHVVRSAGYGDAVRIDSVLRERGHGVERHA